MNNRARRKEKTFKLLNHIDDADGSVVSKTLLKRQSGKITRIAFDLVQGFPFGVLGRHSLYNDRILAIPGQLALGEVLYF